MFNNYVAKMTKKQWRAYDAGIMDAIHAAQGQEVPRAELQTIHDLSLAAGNLIRLSWGFDIPDPAVSEHLLHLIAEHNDAMAWYRDRVIIDADGCWTLPLAAEYDDKGRARYPQLSKTRFKAKSELAHRFVVRRTLGATGLTRGDHLDHQCRKHACSNITHLMLTTTGQNTTRGTIARRSTDGLERMF